VQYWSMRVMAYLASLVLVFALWGAWLLHRRKLHTSRWFLRVAPWVIIGPFLINTAGWMLTESGRQPWIVQGLMKTANGVSPSVSATDIWISLVVFYVIFIAFGIADAWLMIRYGRKPLDHDPIAKLTSESPPTDAETSDEDEPALVY
jgi:cytochrome d ubiquinol oxidase subunit I